jgi:hypothetical protein
MRTVHPFQLAAVALPLLLLIPAFSGCGSRSTGIHFGSGSSRSVMRSGSGDDQRIEIKVVEDGIRTEFDSKGSVTFAPDDQSVAALSPGGHLRIQEQSASLAREVLISGDQSRSQINTIYRLNGNVTALDAEGKQWLSRMFDRVITETPIGATPRAERILADSGADGLLTEIERLKGGQGQQDYLQVLLAHDSLQPGSLVRAVQVVAAHIGSASTLSRMLAQIAERETRDEPLSLAIVEATHAISSSSDHSECLRNLVKHRSMTPAVSIAAIRAAARISSSSAMTDALRAIVRAGPGEPEVQLAYVEATASISSNSDRGEALQTLLDQEITTPAVFVAVAEAARRISSSSTQQGVLEKLIAQAPNDGQVWTACLDAIADVSSASSQEQIMVALLRRPNLDRETLGRAGEAIKKIVSSSARERLQQTLIERLAQ